MDHAHILSMLEMTIEIEGLLRVLMSREDPEASRLLDEKIDLLGLSNLNRSQFDTTPQPAVEPQEEPTIAEEPAVAPEPTPIPEPAAAPEPPVSIADDFPEVVRVEDVISKKKSGEFAAAFSINDKFRYIRELFDGDVSKFDETTEAVERMSSLDQAYDYFLNDLEWDADQDAVSDFLVMVANHFNSAS